MSHSTVLVIGNNHEALLEPYDENKPGPGHWEVEANSVSDCWWIDDKNKGDVATLAEALKIRQQECPDEADRWRLHDGAIEYLSTYNPDSRWDWYAVGGRWSGHLKLKAGRTGAGEGKPEAWNHDAVPTGRCDQARKGDLDIEGMRSEAATRADANWDVYEAIVRTHGPLPDRDWTKDYTAADFAAKRDAYWANPTVKALRTCGLIGFLDMPNFDAHTRESWIERARLRAVPGFALLDDEHGWLETGRMGWWGVSDETPDSELAYLKRANQIIDDADDCDLFTLVDVHI